MANLFDNLQRTAFKIVSNTMGYDASWQPSDGSDEQTARVLKKEPTQEWELAGVEYTPVTYLVEYHRPDFAGLFESVNNGGTEIINVDGEVYLVRSVTALRDGKNYRAVIQPTE